MKEYKINEEDLFELAYQVYQEGYKGYQEMGESVARKLVKKFLKGKEEVVVQEPVEGDAMQTSVILDGGYGQWSEGEGAQITLVPDDTASNEIILPHTTISSWDTLGNEE